MHDVLYIIPAQSRVDITGIKLRKAKGTMGAMLLDRGPRSSEKKTPAPPKVGPRAAEVDTELTFDFDGASLLL